MNVAGFEFRPTLWPSLATICLLPLFLSLGNWQMNRADEKQLLQELQQQQLQSDQVNLSVRQNLNELADYVFRKVSISGRFLPQHYLLDNQIWQGRVGYDVYSLLTVADSNTLMLVNRGWIAMSGDRRVLPEIETPVGERYLSGTLSKKPGQLLQLVDYDTDSTSWPRVVQEINSQRIAEQLGKSVSPYVIQLDAQQKEAYQLHWKPYVDTPDKHISYAVQWFSMAVVLIILYIVLNLKRRKVSNS